MFCRMRTRKSCIFSSIAPCKGSLQFIRDSPCTWLNSCRTTTYTHIFKEVKFMHKKPERVQKYPIPGEDQAGMFKSRYQTNTGPNKEKLSCNTIEGKFLPCQGYPSRADLVSVPDLLTAHDSHEHVCKLWHAVNRASSPSLSSTVAQSSK